MLFDCHRKTETHRVVPDAFRSVGAKKLLVFASIGRAKMVTDHGAGFGFMQHLAAVPFRTQDHGLDAEVRLPHGVINAKQQFTLLKIKVRGFGKWAELG